MDSGGTFIMITLSSKIKKEVLLLPSDERLVLIDKLIASLNLPTQSDIDKLWAEEAEQRIKELDNAEVLGSPGEEVFKEVRARLSK
jgi:putative addiction module component (TIGR02574 family)